MWLDNTQIAIRERPYTEILDLALRVARRHAGGLSLCLACGVLPCLLFNHWLLARFNICPAADDILAGESLSNWLWALVLLTVWQIPWATAPATLYLGQVLFQPRVDFRRLAGDWLRSLPQLLLLQGVVRSVLIAVCLLWPVPYCLFPYLNEILLLERNPLGSSRRTGTSTERRAIALHGRSTGDLFVRWMASLLVASTGWWTVWLVLTTLWSLLYGQWEWQSMSSQAWLVPLALWITAGYLTVVRYLSYLDLRIRTEGWEVELALRAAGARLAGQHT